MQTSMFRHLLFAGATFLAGCSSFRSEQAVQVTPQSTLFGSHNALGKFTDSSGTYSWGASQMQAISCSGVYQMSVNGNSGALKVFAQADDTFSGVLTLSGQTDVAVTGKCKVDSMTFRAGNQEFSTTLQGGAATTLGTTTPAFAGNIDTFNWQLGTWSSCSVACGGGTETRSATCIGSQGDTNTSMCSGLTAPVTQQSCNPQACTQACSANNGYGSQTWSGTAYGACQLTSCAGGYNLQSGTCVADVCSPGSQVACAIGNGTGIQTCNSVGSAWGACGNLYACNPGFVLTGGSCSAVPPPPPPPPPRAAQYLQLAADVTVGVSFQTILNTDISIPSTTNLVLQASGRYYSGQAALAAMRIYVDGVAVGSSQVIDWKNSETRSQHSFDAVATAWVAAGTHNVQLVAQNLSPNAAFVVGAGSNLSILQSSSPKVQSASPGHDLGPFSTSSMAVPVFPIIHLPEAVEGPAALLFSGRVFGNNGDSMVGISIDGSSCPNTADQSWSVNDTGPLPEPQAPVFSQGVYTGGGWINPAAIASVFPWNGQGIVDPVSFNVGADSTFISVERSQILGTGYAPGFVNQACDTTAYICVGSSSGWPGCPAADTRAVLAQGTVTIPAGHDGVLMIQAKSRVQADNSDSGGTIYLGLNIDGVDVGSVGVQQIVGRDAESQRTIAASYLADHAHHLSPGTHTIVAWMMVDGHFVHLAANQDLALLFFD